jgi:hypothetical protein
MNPTASLIEEYKSWCAGQPLRGLVPTFGQWMAERPKRAKRAQRGGVRKGHGWAREAEWFRLLSAKSPFGPEHRNVLCAKALTIIANHTRRASTKAEALRLLAILNKLLEGEI